MNLDKNGVIQDSFTYAYDAKGNITSVTSSAGTTTYVYDALEQLIKETRPDGTVIEYSYDAVGNRLTMKETKGGTTFTSTYTYDDADQLTAVNGTSYTYDANGNLTNDGNRTYVYDAENRLIAVKDSDGNTIASFTYRADGMRKTMTTPSGTITFHYDENNNVVYETNESNQIVASYTYGPNNEPVSMTRDGKTYYYQTNYRGDVLALTDSSGNVVATYEYDAFGRLLKETGTVENPYRYAGYRYDKETGLYYLQSRYYNPETGRFLTRDVFEGVNDEPLTINKYIYTVNNPVLNVDPDGFHGYKRWKTKKYEYYQRSYKYGWFQWLSAHILNFYISQVLSRLVKPLRRICKKCADAASYVLARFIARVPPRNSRITVTYRRKLGTSKWYVRYRGVRPNGRVFDDTGYRRIR